MQSPLDGFDLVTRLRCRGRDAAAGDQRRGVEFLRARSRLHWACTAGSAGGHTRSDALAWGYANARRRAMEAAISAI
jgi:hypothetical protein